MDIIPYRMYICQFNLSLMYLENKQEQRQCFADPKLFLPAG